MTKAELEIIVKAAVEAAVNALENANEIDDEIIEKEVELPTAKVGNARLVHYKETGRFAKFGGGSNMRVPIVEVVDDIDYPWDVDFATAKVRTVTRLDINGSYETSDWEEKELPLRLTGAISYVMNGTIAVDGLRNHPWRGVYHPQAYTKTCYSVLDETNERVAMCYGKLPDEPDEITLNIH